MAAVSVRRAFPSFKHRCHTIQKPNFQGTIRQSQRQLQTATHAPGPPPNFAFAFDIDGVLLRSAKPLFGAQKALSYLQKHRIPFILLTNGGGTHEKTRVAEVSKRLGVPLDTTNFIQSHTPFSQMVKGYGSQPPLEDKCVLVTGGDGDNCRQVAENYGFTNVITPADLISTFPALWPFASPTNYSSHARSLSHKTLSYRSGSHDANTIKIDAILVFNDPRDWALDAQIILDLLMSHAGFLGSLSPSNGNPNLSNRGWQQDGQPPLYFSNPDLFWAAAYHLPRLGQGAFREAFKGLWNSVTGGPEKGVELKMHMFGKPHHSTYEFAEKVLRTYRNKLLGLDASVDTESDLKKVYMIGDNPESDILGANQYRSPSGSKWNPILVRSGVYSGGVPAHEPKIIVDDVWEAVNWALRDSGWSMV